VLRPTAARVGDPGTMAAIANAVFDATGARGLPITLDKPL
jgi:CO/xanthine dehydrogenase Mo-binding subunit